MFSAYEKRLAQAVFGLILVVGNLVLMIGEMDVAGAGFLSRSVLGFYVGCGLGLWLLVGAARGAKDPEPDPADEPEPDRAFHAIGAAAALGICGYFAVAKMPNLANNIYAGVTVIVWLVGVAFGLYLLAVAVKPALGKNRIDPPPPEPGEEPDDRPARPKKPWHRDPDDDF